MKKNRVCASSADPIGDESDVPLDDAPLEPITVEQCRYASLILAETNEVHARNRARFAPGKRYTDLPNDDRIYLDAVFIPDGYLTPSALYPWLSEGGGYCDPDEPGQWMYRLGRAPKDDCTLFTWMNNEGAP